MEQGRFWGMAVLGITVGLGMVIMGATVSSAVYKFRAAQRYVTVKGLAEREVDADLVIWPLTFEVATNDLAELQKGVAAKRGIVSQFLAQGGFTEDEVSQSAPRIRDTQSEVTYGQQTPPKFRYVAQATVLLRTSKVALVKQTVDRSAELIGKGVLLVGENYGKTTEFLFTSLNEIKPAMIQEATKNARAAAEQFAKDSGSKVGKIKTATQGLFTITDRDMNSPDKKQVRVVTTVEYYLGD